MDGYSERTYGEVTSAVQVRPGDPGEAKVSITLDAAYGSHTVELISLVGTHDLLSLITDLYECVEPGLRPGLIEGLRRRSDG